MITIPSQEVKRRGIGVVDELLAREPVHVIKNNQPKYVILFEEQYQTMLEDLTLARIEASEADLQAGRIRKGSAEDVLNELDKPESE